MRWWGGWPRRLGEQLGYFSILKRGVYGIYQYVSEAHLH